MDTFKVGDKVRVVGCALHNISHIGRVGVVTDFDFMQDTVVLLEEDVCCIANEVEHISKKGRPAKPKPVMFVAVWDETSGDPAKAFTSKKDLNEWVADAAKSTRIIKDSIRVYKVSKTYEVKFSHELQEVVID